METEHLGYKEVGYKYTTGTRFITPTELDTFCDITGMRMDVFLRDDAAKALGLEGRTVPGVFIMAILLTLIGEIGLLSNGIFLGTNNVRFGAPVRPYDRLRAEGELLNRRVTSKGDRVIVTYSWFMKNQDDDVVAQGENTAILPNPEKT